MSKQNEKTTMRIKDEYETLRDHFEQAGRDISKGQYSSIFGPSYYELFATKSGYLINRPTLFGKDKRKNLFDGEEDVEKSIKKDIKNMDIVPIEYVGDPFSFNRMQSSIVSDSSFGFTKSDLPDQRPSKESKSESINDWLNELSYSDPADVLACPEFMLSSSYLAVYANYELFDLIKDNYLNDADDEDDLNEAIESKYGHKIVDREQLLDLGSSCRVSRDMGYPFFKVKVY